MRTSLHPRANPPITKRTVTSWIITIRQQHVCIVMCCLLCGVLFFRSNSSCLLCEPTANCLTMHVHFFRRFPTAVGSQNRFDNELFLGGPQKRTCCMGRAPVATKDTEHQWWKGTHPAFSFSHILIVDVLLFL